MLSKAYWGMFDVVPEPEFSAWFETLPEPYAEEVAAAIDLAAGASSALAPERLSRMLLWYDGTGTGSTLVDGVGRSLELRELPAHRLRDYLAWHQEVVLCLESVAFRERLERLEPRPAADALALVERVKQRLQAARLTTTYNPWQPAAASDVRGLETWPGVRDTFLELLAMVGLESREVLGSGSGLRELSLSNMKPQLRVLFGLDFPARRLLAILGETLERSYYGDSVKRAERRWQQYLESQTHSLQRRAP